MSKISADSGKFFFSETGLRSCTMVSLKFNTNIYLDFSKVNLHFSSCKNIRMFDFKWSNILTILHVLNKIPTDYPNEQKRNVGGLIQQKM